MSEVDSVSLTEYMVELRDKKRILWIRLKSCCWSTRRRARL